MFIGDIHMVDDKCQNSIEKLIEGNGKRLMRKCNVKVT